MNKEQLNAVIKLVLDRNFEEEEQGYYGDFKFVCGNKDKLQNDLVETLAVFLKDK